MAVQMPLSGVRVLDVSTLFAGPLLTMLLGDFGAEVIKIEHPRGDPARGHGPKKNGEPLWWKMLARNKKAITLYLGAPEGQEIFLKLAEHSDVVVENFRPGTLERWNLGYEALSRANPRLILARVTAFGQSGPYAHRPGFGTMAEAMSGFAHIMGSPDGPPTLPPFALADGVCALAGAVAVMFALYHRDAHQGTGQVIDLAIIDPILTVLGPQPIIYDQLGVVQQRTGNRSVYNAPRNTYLTQDGRWVAVSTSALSVAERVMALVGHPEVISEPWFAAGSGRAEHADLLDECVGRWISERTLDEVVRSFEQVEAAIAPIYDVSQVMKDPQYEARNSVTTIHDDILGPVRMQNIMFRLSATQGQINWTGRSLGADNDEIYRGRLGLSANELTVLRDKHVI